MSCYLKWLAYFKSRELVVSDFATCRSVCVISSGSSSLFRAVFAQTCLWGKMMGRPCSYISATQYDGLFAQESDEESLPASDETK